MDAFFKFLNEVLPKLLAGLAANFQAKGGAYLIVGTLVLGGLYTTQQLDVLVDANGVEVIKQPVIDWTQRILVLIAFIFQWKLPEKKV